MGPVEYSIEEIKARIPPQLLALVFSSTGRLFSQNPGAIEAAIRERVIDGRVRRVVDTAGATQDDIPLFGLIFTPITQGSIHRSAQTVFIPKDRTGGRTISSALSLVYGSTSSALTGSHPTNNPSMGSGISGSSVMLDAALGVLNSATPQGPIQSANVSCVGENVILIEDYIPQGNNLYLRCLLKSDSEFSQIRPQTYQAFSELVVLATKSYIYNNYYIELGRGFLVGGMELPQIQNLVDEYRDADSLFLEYLKEKWYKISSMNDPVRKSRQLKMMVGGRV
jgi:hypothetical protein